MCVPKKKSCSDKTAVLKKSTASKLSGCDTVEEKNQKEQDEYRMKEVFAQMHADANAAGVANMLQEERAKAKRQIKTSLAVGDIGFSYERGGGIEPNIKDDTIMERRKPKNSKERAAIKKKISYKYDRSNSSSGSSVEEYHLQLPRIEEEEPTAQKYMHLYKDMEYMTHGMIYNINAKDMPKVSVDRKVVLDPFGPLDQLECPVFTWDQLKCNSLTTQVTTMPLHKEKTAEEKTAQEIGVETVGEIRVRWMNPVVKKVVTEWLDEQTAEMPSECATGRE